MKKGLGMMNTDGFCIFGSKISWVYKELLGCQTKYGGELGWGIIEVT